MAEWREPVRSVYVTTVSDDPKTILLGPHVPDKDLVVTLNANGKRTEVRIGPGTRADWHLQVTDGDSGQLLARMNIWPAR
jgi:hypothetical protein